MLFVYGISTGTPYMINIINYYEQVFKDDIDIMKNNIPKEFTDFKNPTLDTIETVFLKSAYTENQKYNELMGIIKTLINGGKRKKNKRRSKKRRITKKRLGFFSILHLPKISGVYPPNLYKKLLPSWRIIRPFSSINNSTILAPPP